MFPKLMELRHGNLCSIHPSREQFRLIGNGDLKASARVARQELMLRLHQARVLPKLFPQKSFRRQPDHVANITLPKKPPLSVLIRNFGWIVAP